MKMPHDCWRYHPEQPARVFKTGEEIPDGWYDTPAKFPKAEKPKDNVAEASDTPAAEPPRRGRKPRVK